MADVTGGAISEILAQHALANRTADATAQAATEGQQVAARVQEQVDAIAAELQRTFHDLSARLQDAIRTTSDQLHATQWHGQSREALVRFDQELAATAQGFLASAEEGVASFRTQLMGSIGAFHDQVHQEFTAAMEDIRARYTDAAQAAASFAHGLEELDRTAITF